MEPKLYTFIILFLKKNILSKIKICFIFYTAFLIKKQNTYSIYLKKESRDKFCKRFSGLK